MRHIILYGWIVIALLLAFAASAQDKTPVLSRLLDNYRTAKKDTTIIQALLSLDSFYLYLSDDTPPIWDSAILMASKASKMSVEARYKKGYIDAQFLLANAYAERGDVRSALNIVNASDDTPKVHMLIMVAERYVFRPGELKQNLDSAYLYIQQAITLSTALRSNSWLHYSWNILAKYYFASGNIEAGKNCYLRIIRDCQLQNNKEREANWWAELGRYMPHTDSTFNQINYSYHQAYALYKQLNDRRNIAHVVEDIAYVYMNFGKMAEAQAAYLETIDLKKKAGIVELYHDYSNLSEINLLLGNYNTTLFYALAAKGNLEQFGNGSLTGVVYSQLADAYAALGQTTEALQWYRTALPKLVAYKNEYEFPIVGKIVHVLIERNKAAEAYRFLTAYVQSKSPVRWIDQEIVSASYGDCYTALLRYENAEKYYLQMIAADVEVQSHLKNTNQAQRGNVITGAPAYYRIGKFYVDRKQYTLAKPYLNNAMAFKQFAPSLSVLRDIHFMLFRIDSAQGNYVSAINHFIMQKALNDSIFSDTKSRQIAEMQAKYEINEKEKDIENLKLSENNQAKELQRNIQLRNYTYAIVIILLLLVLVVYNRYRLKQRKNRALESAQQVIYQKNEKLEDLVKDKDKLICEKDELLEEKEWLFKEIHHRVKNNLQVIMSLLNTQLKYLNNKEAVDAVNEIRHRTQSMSLIHQKLYQSENAKSVNMKTYITELVEYLKMSFSNSKQINFNISVAFIELGISQATPIGLILSETITNAIKYAFKEQDGGSISIKMIYTEKNKILLEVADNGCGLSNDFDLKNCSSMGMRLITGLTKQINGKFAIESNHGVCVRTEFVRETKSQSTSVEESGLKMPV